MDEDTINRIWKRTPTPEIDALYRRLVDDALEHGYTLDTDAIMEMCFIAFKVGFEEGRNHAYVVD
jgi:hypothetical protein